MNHCGWSESIKKGRTLLCERSRIKYGFIQVQQKTYPVTVLCRVMEVSASAYYAWCQAKCAGVDIRQDQYLADKVRQIFVENKCSFGSRRLSDRLKKQGIAIGRFKTRRIMRDLELQVRYPKRIKVTTDSNHSKVISPNRLDRQFHGLPALQFGASPGRDPAGAGVPQSRRLRHAVA